MSFTFWLQFVLVCVIGAMSPGPSVALIIRNSVRFSRAAGVLTAIGHACGIGIYARSGASTVELSNEIIDQITNYSNFIMRKILFTKDDNSIHFYITVLS